MAIMEDVEGAEGHDGFLVVLVVIEQGSVFEMIDPAPQALTVCRGQGG